MLLMGQGLHFNNWGSIVNTNYQTLENALAATCAIPVTGNATLTVAQTDCGVITFTGTIAANATITFPSVSRLYLLNNQVALSGGAQVLIQSGANVPIQLPVNSVMLHIWYNDGQNFHDANFLAAGSASMPLAGGTFTGGVNMGSNVLTGLAAPVNGPDAATKTYVDAAVAAAIVTAAPTASLGFFDLTSCPAGWTYAGSGSLLDMRGYFVRAQDNGRGLDWTGGRAIASIESDSFQTHTHSFSIPTASNSFSAAGIFSPTGGATAVTSISGAATTVGAPNSGNPQAETAPKNIALLPCWKN